jgi:hypothetical protein
MQDQSEPQRPTFTLREIHSSVLRADALLSGADRDRVPVLNLLDAERAAARKELTGRGGLSKNEVELHAELVAHKLIAKIEQTPYGAAEVAEQLRRQELLEKRTSDPSRPATALAAISAYLAIKTTERTIADQVASISLRRMRDSAVEGEVIDFDSKAAPKDVDGIIRSARSDASNSLEQAAARINLTPSREANELGR